VAAATGTHVAIGVTERAGGTLYNSLVQIDGTGIRSAHRKLVPTGAERLVWGSAPTGDIDAVDTPFRRVGGLISWEN
jgi:predicted amidohydrolase